jgi:hypothetical protein
MRNSVEPMLHLVHPNPVPWNAIFSRIASTLKVDLVPYSDWVARLEEKRLELEENATAKGGKKPNALNMLDIFFGPATVHSDPDTEAFLPKVSTELARRVVPSFGSIRQLNEEDIDRWLTYWKSIGLIEF